MSRRARVVCFLALASAAIASGARAASSEAVLRLLENGRLQEAEQELRSILLQREDPQARDLLGVVLIRQGRHEEAESQFTQALAVDPGLMDAEQHLARLYLLQNRDAEARLALRAAASLGPLERDLAMKLAIFEMADGNPEAAGEQLEYLAEQFESVQALLYLERIRSERRDSEGATEVLQRALEIAPNSEEVLRSLARLSLANRAPVSAILALEPLTRMHPEEAEYPYLMGVARLQQGDSAGAVAALQRTLELGPPRAVTWMALGLALNGQKRYQEAVEALRESLRLNPEGLDSLAALAEAEGGLDRLEEAEEHARQALARDPDHATANLALGMVYMKRGSYEEARVALEKAVTADPGSFKTHYQLSLAYARLKNPEASREHLELYRKALREFEERLTELDEKTGSSSSRGGMSR